MTVREHIAGQLQERLERDEVLVVYDPERRYAELVASLESDACRVIDTSDTVLVGREDAMEGLRWVGQAARGERRLVVYVPRPKPFDDDGRRLDPFGSLAIAGATFPDGEKDSYRNLCIQAKPDHQRGVEELFASGEAPSMDTVDKVDGGASWPALRSALKEESPKEILVALLAPTDAQSKALAEGKGWQQEYFSFAERNLGLRPNRKLSRWDSIREELTRHVLFSEFVLDLPDDLPEALISVPRAGNEHQELVYAVCAALRDSTRTRRTYIELSQMVEQALALDSHFEGVDEFGLRDTFQFEERAHLHRFARLVLEGEYDEAESVLANRKRSVWTEAEDRGLEWDIAARAFDLFQALQVGEPSKASTTDIIARYADTERLIDAEYRGMEQLVQDAISVPATLQSLVEAARHAYRAHTEMRQSELLSAVRDTGWPPPGVPTQDRVFADHLAPILEDHGRKVALVMVDALRYELAAQLMGQLDTGYSNELHAAAGHLPSITSIGMANLVCTEPGELVLGAKGEKLVPYLDGAPILTPTDRLAHLKKTLGDRVAMMHLDECVGKGPLKLEPGVNLLVVRTTEIDTAGETLGEGLLAAISRVQKKLLRLAHVLATAGFERVVIASDHGFAFFHEEVAGSRLEVPAGNWGIKKDRCLVGSLVGDSSGEVFRASDMGIAGDASHLVVPSGFGVFKTGSTYLHGGLSLQEAIVPVLVVDMQSGPEKTRSVDLQLSYRGGKTSKVTTRLPMIEVALFDMFGPAELTFRLEARAGKGAAVVGEPMASAKVDAGTGLATISAGEAVKIPLRMDDGFEGSFKVVALDPATHVEFGSVRLKTDYVDA